MYSNLMVTTFVLYVLFVLCLWYINSCQLEFSTFIIKNCTKNECNISYLIPNKFGLCSPFFEKKNCAATNANLLNTNQVYKLRNLRRKAVSWKQFFLTQIVHWSWKTGWTSSLSRAPAPCSIINSKTPAPVLPGPPMAVRGGLVFESGTL